jgi:hypothetical protein
MAVFWSILSVVGLATLVWYFTLTFNPYGKIIYPPILWSRIGHFVSWSLIIVGIISSLNLGLNLMSVIWLILSTIGVIIVSWYFSIILDPYSRITYPLISSGWHIVNWILIIGGIFSTIMLYRSLKDINLFLKIIGVVILILIIVRTEIFPLRVHFKDVMGSLYTHNGFRFGGFPTSKFLELTEDLEKLNLGIRERIIGEAFYLISWLDNFPEIAFFLGALFSKSVTTGFICFASAYILEFIRFYTFVASPLVIHLSRIWAKIKFPLFLVAIVLLWSKYHFIAVSFIVFLILQGWFKLISTVIMLPIRLFLAKFLYKAFGSVNPHIHNLEWMAIQYAINRWRKKLLLTKEGYAK